MVTVIIDFDPSRSDCVNSQPLETPLPRRNKMCLWRQFLGWDQDRQGGYGNQPAAARSCTTGPVIHGKRKIDKRQLRNWILLVKRVAFDLLYCTETKNLNVVNKCREKTAAHWICYTKKSSWLWPRQQRLRCNWTTSGEKTLQYRYSPSHPPREQMAKHISKTTMYPSSEICSVISCCRNLLELVSSAQPIIDARHLCPEEISEEAVPPSGWKADRCLKQMSGK
jgi:hypothetical protein